MKRRKFLFFHTWPGIIFGVVLLGILLGIFVGTPLAIIMTHFFPELGSGSITVGSIVGGLVAGLSVMAKWYWDWADRVMAKFFGSNGDKQE